MNENKQEQRKLTNYEKIKNMDIEEMVEWIVENVTNDCDFCNNDFEAVCTGNFCGSGVKTYLESEVTEE